MDRTPPTSRLSRGELIALGILSVGAVVIVLAATPYKAFELDRHLLPKELALHFVAASSALLCLSGVRRFSLSRVDFLLLAYLALSLVSALFATNPWLALRSVGLSVSGAAVFWAARRLARVGGRNPLVVGVAVAAVVGAGTALLQAYGVESDLVSLTRAPGGTFGNRNFMAHAVVIGFPALALATLAARGTVVVSLGSAGVALASAALVLSRCRAAWLAVVVCILLFLVDRLTSQRRVSSRLRRRLRPMGLAAALGGILGLMLPNTLEWRSDSPYLESLTGVLNYREGSGRGRLRQYAISFALASAHPLVGVGPGNWPLEYPRLADPGDPSIDPSDGMTSNPWPSSDWMAVISERGIPAFLALGLLFLGAALNGWLRWRGGSGEVEAVDLVPLVLTATILATIVTGTLDAVLLLPVPTFFAWVMMGALAPPATTLHIWQPRTGSRWPLLLTGIAGSLLVVRSATQVAAMSLFRNGWSTERMEAAARLDPGSYPIAIRLAERAARRRRCDRVREYAGQAHRLFPLAAEPHRLLQECRR